MKQVSKSLNTPYSRPLYKCMMSMVNYKVSLDFLTFSTQTAASESAGGNLLAWMFTCRHAVCIGEDDKLTLADISQGQTDFVI